MLHDLFQGLLDVVGRVGALRGQESLPVLQKRLREKAWSKDLGSRLDRVWVNTFGPCS